MSQIMEVQVGDTGLGKDMAKDARHLRRGGIEDVFIEIAISKREQTPVPLPDSMCLLVQIFAQQC